jgi:GH18 family chitinase
MCAACLLSACATPIAYIPPVAEGFGIPAGFRIVGYFPSWSGDPTTIQYRALTHICYAFGAPTMEGGYKPIDNVEKLVVVIALAHTTNVKVLLSLGGWNDGDTNVFEKISSDPDLTARFVDATLAELNYYDFDGIDMDWEFPGAASSANFATLMSALSVKLHEAGKELSIAVSATDWHGRHILDSVIADVDFLNIMAYDDGYGMPPGVPHSSYWFARNALDYWVSVRQVPREKAILGVPFYGRSLKDRHSISYFRLRKSDPRASASDVSGEFGYNGFDTLRAKAVNLARARAGGIMIWQLNQDASGPESLLNAIFDVVKEPVEPQEPVPLTAPPASNPAAPSR